jgi:hypothetical protein
MPPLPSSDRHSAGDAGTISVVADVADDVAILAATGPWSRQLGMRVHGGLREAMAEHPSALVLDLSAMADPQAASAPAWINARRVGQAMDPAIEVAVCVPGGTALGDRLRGRGDARLVPVYDSVAQARAAVRRQPQLTDEVRLALPPRLESCSLARLLVTDACTAWRMPALVSGGRLVISELVGNAAQHARTPMIATVARRVRGMRVAVYDRDPRMPMLLPPPRPPSSVRVPDRPLYPDRGHGLRLVEASATRWGSMPTDDGKMVWATLHPRRDLP